jgi:hypothetical protein
LFSEGHDFSRAEQVLYFCHSERASAREESAFQSFQQPVSAVPLEAAINAALAAGCFCHRSTDEFFENKF